MPEQNSDTSGKPSRRSSAAGTPRWVKLFAIAAAAVIVLFLAAHLFGLAPVSHQM